MMKFKIPFSLFLGLVFSLANAQTFKKPKPGSPFINIGLGGGGYMHSPAMSPYDKKFMYTNCDMGCVYVTRDGGKKWRTIPFYDIAGREGIAVFDKKNIYLKGGGISVSSDKGRTWKIRKKFPWPKSKQPFRAFETLGIGSKYLAVGNDSGLWLSQNAGKNWKQTFKKKVIEVAGLGDNIFLAGEKSFWLSKNLGKTWKNISPKNAGAKQIVCITAGQDGAGMVVFVLLDDKSTLLSSRDWGKTWASSKLGGAPVRSRNMVRMASNQSKILFTNRKANKGGELWRSKDSGKTWKRVAYCRKGWAPGTKDSEFAGRHKWGFGRLNFAVDPTNTKRVMFTTMSDIFISTNAGDTWKQMYNDDKGRIDKGSKDFFCTTRGLTMTSAWQFHFDPFDRKRQYICYTDFGFIRSIDGGKSWAGSPPANSTYAIVFDPKKKGRIYGAASGTHDIPGWGFTHDKKYGKGRVVYSDDHGDNWKTLGKGFPNIPCTHLALDKKRSKNGKLTFWATFYGRGGGGLYRSNDTGQTWKQIKGLGYSHNVNFLRVKIQPKTGDIFVSVGGTRKVGTMDFKTGGFWHSTDDGKTWKDIAKSLDLRWQKGFTFHPTKTGTIYLAASTPPKFPQGGVYKTTNNGKTWKQVLSRKKIGTGILQVYSVDIHPTKPNIVYACTAAGLWCSRNDGKTWKMMKVPHFRTTHVTVDPKDPEVIYCTTFGGGTWVGYYLP